MQQLQDVFIIEDLQILTEDKKDGKMRIKGIFGRCNEKNNNGRIYPTAVLESQLQKVQPLIAERRLCGELDHPQNDTVRLSNASHLITKLELKGNDLIGEAEVLRTPAGLTAQALINGGVKLGISSRGMGTLSEDDQGNKVVNEDFKLVTFDLVADPSTRGAFPGLSESTQSKFATETQSKLTKEGNFVTMLEARMRESFKPFIEEAKSRDRQLQQDIRHIERGKKADAAAKKKSPALERIKKEAALRKKHQEQDLDGPKEAFELVKQEGSWHKIAEAVKHTITTSRGKTHKASSDRAKKYEGALFKRTQGASNTRFDPHMGAKKRTETKTYGGTRGAKDVSKVKMVKKVSESYHPLASALIEALGLGRSVGDAPKRSFKVGKAMADKEHADPSTASKHKGRRAKLKAAGHKNVSAGMADRSKELRGQAHGKPKKK